MEKFQRGQALLIIMLAMATIAVLVLSIVSRSVSQVELAGTEEESLRAFSAAEAGIEQALVSVSVGSSVSQNLNVTTQTGDSSTVGSFDADVVRFPEIANQYPYPFSLLSGESAAVWLVTKNGDSIDDCSTSPCFSASDLRVCWGAPGTNPSDAEAPAISLSFIYENASGDFHTNRVAFDPQASRTAQNSFSVANVGACTIGGVEYAYSANLDLPTIGLPISTPGAVKLIRVKPLYNSFVAHSFGVSSSGDFPTQGKKVTSTGQSGVATRKIEAFLVNPAIPSIFDSAVFSEVGIVK